ADQGDGDHEYKDYQPADALRAAQEARAAEATADDAPGRGVYDRTHLRLVRSLGTRNTTTRSAAMLMAMYSAARTSVMPWMRVKSRSDTDCTSNCPMPG